MKNRRTLAAVIIVVMIFLTILLVRVFLHHSDDGTGSSSSEPAKTEEQSTTGDSEFGNRDNWAETQAVEIGPESSVSPDDEASANANAKTLMRIPMRIQTPVPILIQDQETVPVMIPIMFPVPVKIPSAERKRRGPVGQMPVTAKNQIPPAPALPAGLRLTRTPMQVHSQVPGRI